MLACFRLPAPMLMSAVVLLSLLPSRTQATTIHFSDTFDDNDFLSHWQSGTGNGTRILSVENGRVRVGSAAGGAAHITTNSASKPTVWNVPVRRNWSFQFEFEIPSVYHPTLASAGLNDAAVEDFEFLRLTRSDGTPPGLVRIDIASINTTNGNARLRLFNNYFNFFQGTETLVEVSRDEEHTMRIFYPDGENEFRFFIDGALVATLDGAANVYPNQIRMGSANTTHPGEIFLDDLELTSAPEPSSFMLLGATTFVVAFVCRRRVRRRSV